MKSFPSLLAVSAVLTLAGQGVAQAQDIALSFDLEAPPSAAKSPPESSPESSPEPRPEKASAGSANEAMPLPIPENGANPPVARDSGSTISAAKYGGANAIALAQANPAAAAKMLPPPPPVLEPPIYLAAESAAAPAAKAVVREDWALAFGAPPSPQAAIASPDQPDSRVAPVARLSTESAPEDQSGPFDPFAEGSDSLVARIVGSAEGTRTPSGQQTAAYFGHKDPGNGVWNMGTFSYQHGAQTPEEADQKQLNRLKAQTQVLTQKAADKGIELTLEEKLNGIDLANQSPLAAIGRVGYIDRLAEARQIGLTGEEAIVHARTRSYINPDTNRWNAPGLGNTAEGVTRDQTRRMQAISQALEAYQQQHPERLASLVAESPDTNASTPPATGQTATPQAEPPDSVPIQFPRADSGAKPASSQNLQADAPGAVKLTPAEIAAELPAAAIPTSLVSKPAPKSTAGAVSLESTPGASPSKQDPDAALERLGLLQSDHRLGSETSAPATVSDLAEAPEAVDALLNQPTSANPL